MLNSNRTVVVLLALLGWVQCWSQNADMTNEPTSGDLLTIQILRGQRSVGSGSILPPRLQDLLPQNMPRDTFQRYLASYYWPLTDTLPQAWEILPVHTGRRAIASVRDSVLALRVDASASARGGIARVERQRRHRNRATQHARSWADCAPAGASCSI